MIESITLQGFKSFAARTRLEFGPGVSAIIGPNGSGKSNVVEAIRWVTHQARARELRAAQASELIFHGSGAQSPLGLAEVRLELRMSSNPANQSINTSHSINISRRLYRDGASEQDLGGRPVRVRDLHSALRGSGLGPGGLAVIGQGEVANVVQAEPRALLGHLQEAAGLGRAVAARLDTESRLQMAEVSLRELRLIEAERAASAHRLELAADTARRARTLSLRELALTSALARARQDSLQAEWQAARVLATQLEAESAALRLETSAALARGEVAREALHAARAAAQSAAQQAEAKLALLGAAERAAEGLGSSLAHLRRERQAALVSAAPPVRPDQAEADPADITAELASGRAEAASLERQRRELETALVTARRSEARQLELRARAEALGSALSSEYAELDAANPLTHSALEVARAELAQAVQSRQTSEAQAHALTAQRAELETRRRQLGTRLAELAAARSVLEREYARLERQLSSYARYAEGPRLALLSGHPGVIGSVADVLQVPAEYQVAALAALGRRLEQVVVVRADDAREIIDVLKREGGRATFLPLDLLRPPGPLRGNLRSEPGVIGALAELCPSDPEAVSHALLQGTLLLEDLGAATRLARKHASRPRLVTLSGELIEPGGALTGGRPPGGSSPLLGETRRLQELSAEQAALDNQSAQTGAQMAELNTRLAALVPPADIAPHLAAERTALLRLNELETSLRLSETRRLALDAQRAGLIVPVTLTPDIPALDARLADLQSRLDAWRLQERTLTENLAAVREVASGWALYRAALERVLAAQQRLEANAAALAEQEARHAQAVADLGELRQPAQANLEAVPVAELQHVHSQSDQAQSDYAALLERQNAVRARLDETLLQAARREGSLEAVPEGPLPPGVPRDWTGELSQVRPALLGLGPVNARAEAEHAQAAADLALLSAQVNDAASAAAELGAHLAELAHQEAEATEAAYGRVNLAFAEYSRELLGGVGELEAERGEDGQLTGLRLSVQPGGKRTRSLNLLSAGERTMAGLGFLFALSRAQSGGALGLPLAVLDEVDAPLDEANIRRFTHFLEVFAAQGAQFLLVTHQKATMQVAQAIWGVTTDRSGASTILSIRQGEHG